MSRMKHNVYIFRYMLFKFKALLEMASFSTQRVYFIDSCIGKWRCAICGRKRELNLHFHHLDPQYNKTNIAECTSWVEDIMETQYVLCYVAVVTHK